MREADMPGVSTALREIAKDRKSVLQARARRRAHRLEAAQSAALAESGPSLVVATYNVHACVGTDRRYDPARIAAVLRELGADIISLQEVGGQRRPGQLPDQAAFLARETGLEIVSGPNRNYRRSRFGNAILTRFPVLAVRYIDLSVPGCEPRGALDVDLDIGERLEGQALRVVATHLGLRGGERHMQTNRLLAALAATGGTAEAAPVANAAGADTATLMMGDLNEWRGRRGGIRALDRELGHAPAPRTFPSWCPILPLDRIYAGPPALVRDVIVHRSPLARLASDHLPLRARLAWRAAA
jgi:endonuclease/exonuclease/phosphatase family metal-dependent hydrolase